MHINLYQLMIILYVMFTSFSGLDIVCHEPSWLSHTTVEGHNNSVGSTMYYHCVLGYDYSSGNTERQCRNNGLWTGAPLSCTSKQILLVYLRPVSFFFSFFKHFLSKVNEEGS